MELNSIDGYNFEILAQLSKNNPSPSFLIRKKEIWERRRRIEENKWPLT